MQIFIIRAVYKKTGPSADDVDDGSVQLLRYGRASFAPAEETPLPDMIFTDIFRGMHNDRSVEHIVIPAFFHSFQTKRVTMLSDEGFAGEIKPKAAHEAIAPVGKPGGEKRARIAAMRDEGIE